MIDGLKLTMNGGQLRALLDGRIRSHQRLIQRYSKQLKSPKKGRDEIFPPSVLEAEIANSERRIDTLTLIREYVVPDEVYRLGEFDLRFADLLPDDDLWDCGCVPPSGSADGAPPTKKSEAH